MADKDDVLSLFGHSVDEGNSSADNDKEGHSEIYSDDVSEPGFDRNERNLRPKKRGRGRGRGNAVTSNVRSDSLRKPSKGKIAKKNDSEFDISKLRQQLGLNKIEKSLETLTSFMVEKATEKRDSAAARKDGSSGGRTQGYDPQFHVRPGSQLSRNFALGAPEQDDGPIFDEENCSLGDESSYNQSFYDPDEDTGFWPVDNYEEWYIPQNESEEPVGPKISEPLAQTIDRACCKKADSTKLGEIVKRYPRPENCEFLGAPKVNPDVWGQLPRKVQTSDVALQEVQKLIAAGLTPLTRLAEVLVSFPGDVKDKQKQCKSLISDSVALLGNAIYTTSVKRRYALRPALQPRYRNLCSQDVPITKQLFGDDIAKKIKEINEIAKVSITTNNYGYRRQNRGFLGYQYQRRPYGRGQGGFRNPGRYNRYPGPRYGRQSNRGQAPQKDKAVAPAQ